MLENRCWAVDCFSVSEGRAAGKISKTGSLYGFFVFLHHGGTLDTCVVIPILWNDLGLNLRRD